MDSLKIIGTAVGCGIFGTIMGFWLGEREGGDFNFAPVFYAPAGAAIGGLIGVVIGSLVWAH